MQIRSSRDGSTGEITYGLNALSSEEIKLGGHVKGKVQ